MIDISTGNGMNIADYFKQAASKYSNQVAVTDDKGFFTYQELDILSDKIAYKIGQLLSENKGVIAILMERSKECIAVMLGILKSGYAYMYIDPKYPSDRIQYMVDDSNARLVIGNEFTDKSDDNVLQAEYKELISCEPEKDFIGKADISRKDGAYVIYTSGSTGKPKGLMISHGNFIGLYKAWGKEHFRIDNKSELNVAVIAPFVFDMCVMMIYVSLFEGHNLFVISEETKQSGQGIVKYINDNHIDIMDATPNYLRLMSDFWECHKEEKTDISKIFCIGDVLNYHLAKKIIYSVSNPNFKLYNTYGPAECTVLMTYFIMDRNNVNLYDTVPIGEKTSNSSYVIVDDNMNPVKDGEIGELIIQGDCVGMGYISKNLKGKNPFGVMDAASYKTGDLVKSDDNKLLYFVGRVDRQCKINGYRIELEEIEKRIESIDGIREARVIVDKKDDGFVKLYAFYTGTTQTDVKSYLRTKIPYYMIPQEVRGLDEFPTTQNGKVDYKTLLALVDSKTTYDKDLEQYIKDTICKLSGYKEDNWDISFWEAGGDSITLLALASELYAGYGIELNISKLYECKSINDIVTYAKHQHEYKKVEKRSNEKAAIFSIIESQKKILNLERKTLKTNPDRLERLGFSLIYKITFSKQIDKEKLEKCICDVMSENEIFSVGLKTVRNRYFWYRKNPIGKVVIRQGINESNVLQELNEILVEDEQFWDFVQYGSNVIYMQIKHIYLDFISVQYFLDDVLKLYEYGRKAPKRKGILDYLAQNDFTQEGELSYWKKKLELPASRTKLPEQCMGDSIFRVERYDCADDLYQMLKTEAKKHTTSTFTLLLYFLCKNLKQEVDNEYIKIGCYCPGRNYQYDTGVLGMFTNVLPFICDVSKGDLLERIKVEAKEMLDNQNISLSKLYQMTSLENIEDGEMFDICFNYQNTWMCMEGNQTAVKEINTVNMNPDITQKDFYFGVIEENGRMQWEIKYNSGIYTKEYVDTFINKMKEDVINECVQTDN